MMQHIEILLKIIALITGCAAACGVICKYIINPIKSLCEKVDSVAKHQAETHLATLRLTICSDEMPLEERIAAGDKYIKLGGNGAVKHKYKELLAMLK